MPPTSVDKMLEYMMMQMFNSNQNAATAVCCNCFKVKKRESQRSSNTSSKCRKSSAPKKHKKRRRKLKKSCLRTIICLTKMAKDGGECQGCSCDPCCGNVNQDVDERFCSKCGQLLPGMMSADQPINQPDEQQCLEQLQRCQQEYKDMAVQASVLRNEPVSVRIKVCPCPNANPRSQDDKLYRSVSLPELSSTNSRLVDDATSGNLVSSRARRTRFEDSNQDESSQSQGLKGLNETTPEWPVDVASMKKLALNMAKARLVEEAACWKREYARRYLQQERQWEMYEHDIDDPSDVEPRKSAIKSESSGVQRRSAVLIQDGQEQSDPTTSEFNTQMRRPTYPNYSPTHDMDLCNEYPGAPNFGVSYAPRQGMAAGCCASTDVYCYSPQNGPSPYGDHCEHACTCGNTAQFQRYQNPGPYSGYQYHSIPHKQEFGVQQDRSRPDPYNLSYGSLGNCPRSSCR